MTTVALIGPDGAGKSSIIKRVTESLQELKGLVGK